MSKKNLTQTQLEKKVRELEKDLDQIRRKYKRALKQLAKYEDVDVDRHIQDESDEIEAFDRKEAEAIELSRKEASSYFEVELPDGSVKKIKKRLST